MSFPCPASPSLRHLPLPPAPNRPFRTSFRLESAFWDAIDALAEKNGRTWQSWAIEALDRKPEGVGASSWLRVSAIQQQPLPNPDKTRQEP